MNNEYGSLGKLGYDLMRAQHDLQSQRYTIEQLRIRTAMYKAYFFRKAELGDKLRDQNEENDDALTGAFDGIAYASWRANAVFRSLEDMYKGGLLTEKEYDECQIL